MVAAIVVDRPSVPGRALVDRVVAPFPDKGAANAVILLDQPEVVLVIAGPVSHGMGIFTEDIGLVRLTAGHLLRIFPFLCRAAPAGDIDVCRPNPLGAGFGIADHILEGGVHPAVQIDVGIVVSAGPPPVVGALVVGQARWIVLFCPAQGLFICTAVAAFISHRPDHDTGAVLVAVNHFLHAVQGRLLKSGIVGDHLVPAGRALLVRILFVIQHPGAVALVVRFVDDKKAILVTHLIEHGRIRVVARPDGVEVVPLHHLQVTLHVLDIHHRAGHGIRIVAVYPPELDRLPVDLHNIPVDTDFPDPDPVCDDLLRGLEADRVQIGILTAPQVRCRDRNDGALPKRKTCDLPALRIEDGRGDRRLRHPAVQVGGPDGDLRAGRPASGLPVPAVPCPGFSPLFPGIPAPGVLRPHFFPGLLLFFLPVDLRTDQVIKEAVRRTAQQVDIPEYP